MPVLPLIDLMILIAWTSLMWAVMHKALWLALASRFTILGLVPYDFLLIAGVSLLFALALAARVWVKANEARLIRHARSDEQLRDYEPPDTRPAPRADGSAMGDRAAAG